ncbi:hypothetical protein KCU92_g37, partial [Aureobasidium melanogenum]
MLILLAAVSWLERYSMICCNNLLVQGTSVKPANTSKNCSARKGSLLKSRIEVSKMIRGISPFRAGEAASFLRASSSTACFGSGAPSGLISSAVTSGSAIMSASASNVESICFSVLSMSRPRIFPFSPSCRISDLFACSCARFAYRPAAQSSIWQPMSTRPT